MKIANTCDFYSEGFFGYGMPGDFKYFSIWHFLPIVLLVAAIIITYKYKDKIKKLKHEETIRTVLAVILLMSELGYYWRLLYAGSGDITKTTLLTKLPLQVCDWSCIISIFMLLKKDKKLFPFCYFITLTLGIMPLITPAVITTTGPHYFRYYQYWLNHITPIYVTFYMMFIHGFSVKYKDVVKPVIELLILATLSIYFNNKIPQANFMYLAANTPGDSLANVFPANNYIRLVIYSVIAMILFSVVYIPIHFKNKKA